MRSGKVEHRLLSWEDVAILREVGSGEAAALAERLILARERRANRWWRRLLRRLFTRQATATAGATKKDRSAGESG